MYWFFYDVPKIKKCKKCKSKKIKHHIMHDNHKDILYRRVPASTCRKCGQVHVGIHAMVMDQTLETWLSESNPGTAN